MSKAISKRIAKARGKRSQRDVARQAGLTHKQVGRVEQSSDTMSFGVVRRVADAVGLEVIIQPKKP
jgi:transcriptional regulator with XRE-family HTH domain